MKKFTTVEGIIYRVYESGADDKIINLVNKKGEKITILFKGSKKANSKKGGLIEIGNYVKAKYIEGYNVNIGTDLNLIKDNSAWKKGYIDFLCLQTMCEVIDKFAFENNESPELFTNINSALNSYIGKNNIYIVAIFLLKIMHSTGSFEEEQLLPKNHEYNTNTGLIMDKDDKSDIRILKTQKFILNSDYKDSLRVNLSNVEKNKMLKLHVLLIENYIEKELKSKKLIYSYLQNNVNSIQ